MFSEKKPISEGHILYDSVDSMYILKMTKCVWLAWLVVREEPGRESMRELLCAFGKAL